MYGVYRFGVIHIPFLSDYRHLLKQASPRYQSSARIAAWGFIAVSACILVYALIMLA